MSAEAAPADYADETDSLCHKRTKRCSFYWVLAIADWVEQLLQRGGFPVLAFKFENHALDVFVALM